MSQPFEVVEDGKVRIVGAVIRDNALVARWSIIIKKCERSGLFYAAGFGLGTTYTDLC